MSGLSQLFMRPILFIFIMGLLVGVLPNASFKLGKRTERHKYEEEMTYLMQENKKLKETNIDLILERDNAYEQLAGIDVERNTFLNKEREYKRELSKFDQALRKTQQQLASRDAEYKQLVTIYDSLNSKHQGVVRANVQLTADLEKEQALAARQSEEIAELRPKAALVDVAQRKVKVYQLCGLILLILFILSGTLYYWKQHRNQGGSTPPSDEMPIPDGNTPADIANQAFREETLN